MARLPTVGSDDGAWGDLLNEFLKVEHNDDGSLRIRAQLSGKYSKPSEGIPKSDLQPLLINDSDIEEISVAKIVGLETALQEKQHMITVSTNGTSGPATFVNNTLNIPSYALGETSVSPVDLKSSALTDTPFVTIGNSFNVPDANLQRVNNHYTQMLRDQMGMLSLTTNAVGGTTASEIALNTITNSAIATVVPVRNKAYVGASVMGNNIFFGTSEANRKTVRWATETLMAALTADAKYAANTSHFVYSMGFTGFPIATAIGGSYAATFNDTAYAEFAFSGEQGVDIVFYARADNYALCRIQNVDTGTLIGEISTQGVIEGEKNSTPIIFKVRGQGPGTHRIRITKVSGTAMIIDGILIPSSAPRSGYVVCELPPDPVRVVQPGVNFAETRTALWEIVSDVVAGYPTFTTIQPTTIGWDPVTMTADGLHANDRGQHHIFREVAKQIVATPYSIGNGNLITRDQVYPAAYVPPTPPSIPAGGSSGSSL